MADSSSRSVDSSVTAMSDPKSVAAMPDQKPEPKLTTSPEVITTDPADGIQRLVLPRQTFESPLSPAIKAVPTIFRPQTPVPEFEHYFSGPRDVSRHSKWPLILRIHGSIVPRLIMPVIGIGAWTTAMTLVHKKVHDISVDSLLLNILGVVVGFSLTFRSSTAYERYAEGRRCWGQLVLASQALGRLIWFHVNDEGVEDSHELVVRKLTSMNLVVAFSVALKHSLRFEPYSSYTDLHPLIGHLHVLSEETLADEEEPDRVTPKHKSFFKSVGEHLGVSFAESNPRKALKRATRPLGNLPLEILNYLFMSIDSFHANKQIRVFNHESIAYTQLTIMNDIMVSCGRILDTPLPIAYSIAVSQITFVYILLLPFQILEQLGWITIPATVAAAYIILGLLFIGQEIENPFGHDVNDLPLEAFCDEITEAMDVIATLDKSESRKTHLSTGNMPLFPLSKAPASVWAERGAEKLEEAIHRKPKAMFEMRQQSAKRQNSGTKK